MYTSQRLDIPQILIEAKKKFVFSFNLIGLPLKKKKKRVGAFECSDLNSCFLLVVTL